MKQKTIRKLLLFLMALLIAPSGAWAGHEIVPVEVGMGFATTDLSGDGDQSTPYVIKTAKGWNVLATAIANGIVNSYGYVGGGYAKPFVKLDAGFTDVSGIERPLGTYSADGSTAFKGQFDGNGNTLSGTVTVTIAYFGLFGDIDGATIDNFNIDGLTINNIYSNTALVVGYMRSGSVGATTGIDIQNSTVNYTETSSGITSFGGVVGTLLGGTVSNVTLTRVVVNGGSYVTGVGAFVGTMTGGSLSNCTYDATTKISSRLATGSLSNANYWGVKTANAPVINEKQQNVGIAIGNNANPPYYPYDLAGAKYRITAPLVITVTTDGVWNQYDFGNKVVPTSANVTVEDNGEAIPFDETGADGFIYYDASTSEYTVTNNTTVGTATMQIQLPRLDLLADPDATAPWTNQGSGTFNVVARDLTMATYGALNIALTDPSSTTFDNTDQKAKLSISELEMTTLVALTAPGATPTTKKWSAGDFDAEATLTQTIVYSTTEGGAYAYDDGTVKKAGYYKIKIDGSDNFTGTVYSPVFTVNKLQLHRNEGQEDKAGYVIYADIANPVYDGTAKEPTPEIKVVMKDGAAGTVIATPADFAFSYDNNTNVTRETATDLTSAVKAGAKITVTAAANGNFDGSVFKYFQIDPKEITTAVADYTWATSAPAEDNGVTTTGNFEDVEFDNTDHMPVFTIESLHDPAIALVQGASVAAGDFTATWKDAKGTTVTELKNVTYDSDDNLSVYTQTIQGQGNYTGTINRTKKITQASLATAGKTVITITPKVYNTETQTASEYTVTYNHATPATLVEGDDKDFTVTKNAGGKDVIAAPFYEFEITAAALGNYTGSFAVGAGHADNGFEITQKDIADGDVTFTYTDTYTYRGAAIPAIDDVTITFGDDDPLVITTDYTYVYNKPLGTACAAADVKEKSDEYVMVITGAGNYKGTKNLEFEIEALDLATCLIDFPAGLPLTFNKNDQAPTVRVFVDNDADGTFSTGDFEVPAADYTLSYKDVRKSSFGDAGYHTHAGDVFVKATKLSDNVINATDGTHKYAISPKEITLWADGATGAYGVTNKESNLEGHQYEGETIAILPGAGVIAFIDNEGTPSDMTGAAYAATPALTTDYQVKYEKNNSGEWEIVEPANVKNAGDYRMTIEGINDYTGSHVKTFTIAKRTITEAMFKPFGTNVWNKEYTGNTLTATIVNGGFVNSFTHDITLTETTDYTITANAGGIVPGDYVVTIDGAGDNYTGQVTGNLFTIDKRDLSHSGFTLTFKDPDEAPNKYVYNGSPIEPDYKIVYTYTPDGASDPVEYELTKTGTEADLVDPATYSGTHITPETYTLTATAAGTSKFFTGTLAKDYVITKFDLADAAIELSAYDLTYNAADQAPATIRIFIDNNDNGTFDAGDIEATAVTDYALTYKDAKNTAYAASGKNRNAGKVALKFTAEALSVCFKGENTDTFYIIKPKLLEDAAGFTWTPATGSNYANATYNTEAQTPATALAITDDALGALDMPGATYADVDTLWQKYDADAATWSECALDNIKDAGTYRQVITGHNMNPTGLTNAEIIAAGITFGNYYTTAPAYRTFIIDPRNITDFKATLNGADILTFEYVNTIQPLGPASYATDYEWTPGHSLFYDDPDFGEGIKFQGSPIVFDVTFGSVTYGGKTYTLTVDNDYTVEYNQNAAASEFNADENLSPYVYITGKGNYTGVLKQYFTITKQKIGFVNVGDFGCPEVGTLLDRGVDAYVYIEDNTGDRTLDPSAAGYHGNIIKNTDQSVLAISGVTWSEATLGDQTGYNARAEKIYTAHITLSIPVAKRASYELVSGFHDYEAQIDSFPSTSRISGTYEMTIDLLFPKTPKNPEYVFNPYTRELTIKGVRSQDTGVDTEMWYVLNADEELKTDIYAAGDEKDAEHHIEKLLDPFEVNTNATSRVIYLKTNLAGELVPMAKGAKESAKYFITASPALGQDGNQVLLENIDDLNEIYAMPYANIPTAQLGTKAGENVASDYNGAAMKLYYFAGDKDYDTEATDAEAEVKSKLVAGMADWTEYTGKFDVPADKKTVWAIALVDQKIEGAAPYFHAYSKPTPLSVELKNKLVLAHEWNTYMADKDYAVPAGLKVYTISGMVDNKVTVTEQAKIQANVPVLLKQVDDASVTYYLSNKQAAGIADYDGTLDGFDKSEAETAFYNVPNGKYTGVKVGNTFDVTATADVIYVLKNNEFIRANRGEVAEKLCFLAMTSNQRNFVRIYLPTDEETVIDTIEAAENVQGEWYNVKGMKLDEAPTQKGVYIFNGRKVVIK